MRKLHKHLKMNYYNYDDRKAERTEAVKQGLVVSIKGLAPQHPAQQEEEREEKAGPPARSGRRLLPGFLPSDWDRGPTFSKPNPRPA